MKVIRTIRSTFRSTNIYAQAGEDVKLITDAGTVLIVEGINGRFPVNKNDVTEDINEVIKEENIIINQAPVKKQKRNPVPQNNSLFI